MNSPIGRIGGKRLLQKEIISRFPQNGVGRYIEVFFGAGWVFFGREKEPGQLEVINDKDGNIVNLFRCVKYHQEELQKELEWIVTARETFLMPSRSSKPVALLIFNAQQDFIIV